MSTRTNCMHFCHFKPYTFQTILAHPPNILPENILIQYNLYHLTFLGEEQLVWIIEGSDNRRAKITGLNGVGRVGLRLDNRKFG